jgi:hypothetical protein
MEQSGTHMSDLQRPVRDRHNGHPLVLFAGEHTHPTQYSTMNGAYNSGRTEAQRLADSYAPVGNSGRATVRAAADAPASVTSAATTPERVTRIERSVLAYGVCIALVVLAYAWT